MIGINLTFSTRGTNLIQLLSIAALEKEWLLRGAHETFYAWERLSSRETVPCSNAVRGWKAAPTTYRTNATATFLAAN